MAVVTLVYLGKISKLISTVKCRELARRRSMKVNTKHALCDMLVVLLLGIALPLNLVDDDVDSVISAKFLDNFQTIEIVLNVSCNHRC